MKHIQTIDEQLGLQLSVFKKTFLKSKQTHSTIHGTRIDEEVRQSFCQIFCEGAFSRTGKAIYCNVYFVRHDDESRNFRSFF